jgi:ribosomal protein S18 acetylase RimI-like enzyme
MRRPIPNYQVSAFDVADTDELIQMWRESFEHGAGVKDANPLEEQRQFFEEEILPNTRVQVVRLSGQIVAFLAANSGYLSQLYVRVGHSGQGIGSMLLDLAKEQSSGLLTLHALLVNRRACRFYERHGFTVAGRDFEPKWQLESIEYQWRRSASTA